MRQSQRAGDKLCVASAGQGLPIVNAQTGAIQAAALCIAVLGVSNSPYVAAPWTPSLPDSMGSPGRAFAALGGVPAVGVPDHLNAAGTRAHRSEPALQRPSAALAPHDGGAVIPARAAKPRDNAQVAVGVPVGERGRGARLRHHPGLALAEGNAAFGVLLPPLQARPVQKLPGARQRLWATRARPAWQPWPGQP
jgi:transposase